jgi:hypothetical protein
MRKDPHVDSMCSFDETFNGGVAKAMPNTVLQAVPDKDLGNAIVPSE